MKIELPALPYNLGDLAPTISERTLEFHYGKHHQAYVNNVNTLKANTPLEGASLEEIVKKSEGALFNNAAQVWNHTFYFTSLSPNGGGEPVGRLAEAIVAKWGNYGQFKAEFSSAAVSLFGAGWVWLVANEQGKLDIVKEGNAGNPMTRDLKPLLTFDVWEHAYYLDYQNRRPDHVNAIWDIVNWKEIDKRF
ncbi:MAG: superoxide dismutase [Bacteroidales bacterium]